MDSFMLVHILHHEDLVCEEHESVVHEVVLNIFHQMLQQDGQFTK